MLSRWLAAVFAISASALPAPLYAGAWIQPEGHGQLFLQSSYYTTSAYYDASGALAPQQRYRQYEVQPYVEYGLLDNLTIGGKGLVQHVTQSGDGNTGIADPEIFARMALWKSPTQVISIQPLVKFRSEFVHDRLPRGGSRSTDFELSLLYGRNQQVLDPRDFVDLRIGYRFRGNRLADQYRLDAVYGIHPSEHWVVMPAVRGIYAANQAATPFAQNGEQDYNLQRAELGVQYLLPRDQRVGLTYFHHIAGVQTGAGGGITLTYMQGF